MGVAQVRAGGDALRQGLFLGQTLHWERIFLFFFSNGRNNSMFVFFCIMTYISIGQRTAQSPSKPIFVNTFFMGARPCLFCFQAVCSCLSPRQQT